MPYNKHSILLGLIVTLISVSACVQAQELAWYIGAAAGLSNVGVKQDFWSDSSISAASLNTSGLGYEYYAGYRLNNHFALELDYLQAADTVFKGVSNGSVTVWLPGHVKGISLVSGAAFNALAFWPGGTARTQLFLKGGLLFWNTTARYSATVNSINEFNNDGASPIAGAGLQMRLVRGWDLRAEALYSAVQLAHRENARMGVAVVGLSHSFH